MSVPTVSEIKARFQFMSELPDATVNLFLDEATVECSSLVWGNGTRRQKAIQFLTAHYAQMELQASVESAGAIAALDAQGNKPKFQLADADGDLELTYYGRQFLRLRDRQQPRVGARML
jgi:hypothetical protein